MLRPHALPDCFADFVDLDPPVSAIHRALRTPVLDALDHPARFVRVGHLYLALFQVHGILLRPGLYYKKASTMSSELQMVSFMLSPQKKTALKQGRFSFFGSIGRFIYNSQQS